jgi:uncharacterized membrane protein YphA (DoxX/SURF4 family)
MSHDFGRHAYGAAAVLFGAIGFAWHDFDTWQQLRSLWSIAPLGAALVYIAALAEIGGGIAIQWRRTARAGAAVLGAVYLFFGLRWLPHILAAPRIFDNWGNLFEQLSLVSAAAILYGSNEPDSPAAARIGRSGRYLFGICVISFTLEQLLYLSGTASYVPKWIPPGQMFWAVATTVALALAAAAILSGIWAPLASRLLTAMFLLFGVLVWLPRLVAHSDDHTNWGGNAQNLAITAAAWILADYLGRGRAHTARSRASTTAPSPRRI